MGQVLEVMFLGLEDKLHRLSSDFEIQISKTSKILLTSCSADTWEILILTWHKAHKNLNKKTKSKDNKLTEKCHVRLSIIHSYIT